MSVQMTTEWAKTEMDLRDVLGRDWFLKNPPKFSISRIKIKDFAVEKLCKFLKSRNYQIQSPFLLGNRFLVDIYVFEMNTIIHRKPLRGNSLLVLEALKMREIILRKPISNREEWRILGELLHAS